MTVSRDAIAVYLDSQFSGLAAAVGQSGDAGDGYSVDIDAALRRLGVARSDLATATLDDGLEQAAFALGEYFAARRIWRQLGQLADHTVGETSFKFDGQRKQAKEIMDEAAILAAALGYDVNPPNLDALPPPSGSVRLRAVW